MTKLTSPQSAIRTIPASLDKLIIALEKYSPNSMFCTSESTPKAMIEQLYSAHLTLAKYYCQLPYEEAQKCDGRLRVMEYVIKDILERQRIEALIKIQSHEEDDSQK